MVQSHPWQKVTETPSQPIKLDMVACICHSSYSGSLTRIMIHAGQKISETPSQLTSKGVVVHYCNSSYEGGIGRKSQVRGQPWTKPERPYVKS
jgi:hypothetical protein